MAEAIGRPSWLLIDGSSLFFRSFFAIAPDKVLGPAGQPVNAIRGSLDNLARLIRARRPRAVAVATDEDWRPAWRVEQIPSYKLHRVAEPVPPLLAPQLPPIERLLRAAGLPVVGVPGYEAEDVIASLAARVAKPVEVYSGDRDLFALVRAGELTVLYPERGGMAEVTEAEIERRYAIPGRRYADYAILRGDPSDGLPGLRGVGDKQAAALVRRWGGVEGILAAGAVGSEAADYLRRAMRVVMPVTHLDLAVPAGGLPREAAEPEVLKEMSRELGIESSVSRLLEALAAVAALA